MSWVVRTFLKAVLFSALVLGAILLYLSSPFATGPVILVTNRATTPVTDVLLIAGTLERSIGTIESGATVRRSMDVKHGTQLTLKYRTPQGYVSRGNVGVVNSNFGVQIELAITPTYEVTTTITTGKGWVENLRKNLQEFVPKSQVELK